MPHIKRFAPAMLVCAFIIGSLEATALVPPGAFAAQPRRAAPSETRPATLRPRRAPDADSAARDLDLRHRPARRHANAYAPAPDESTEQAAAAQHEHRLAEAAAYVPGSGPWMAGALAAATQRVDLYVGSTTFDEQQVAELAPMIEALLRASERRLGTTLDRRVSVGFYRPAFAPARGVRGMAYTDQGRAEVFYAPNDNRSRALTVVAHELGHHLEVQRYGQAVQRRADTILHEGLATWVVGERWLRETCGASSWKLCARNMHAQGIPRHLLTAEEYGANNAYELWASFVDYLITHYGWEAFDALYRSGRGRAPGSADYEGVLGKSLEQVADDWRAWLDEH